MNRLSSLIVRPNAAPPHYVLLGIAGVKVVWTALIESCDIATKRKPALVVLVHVQISMGLVMLVSGGHQYQSLLYQSRRSSKSSVSPQSSSFKLLNSS